MGAKMDALGRWHNTKDAGASQTFVDFAYDVVEILLSLIFSFFFLPIKNV